MSQRCLGCMEQYEDEYKVCPHCGYVVGTTAEEAIHMEPGTILHDRYIVGKVLGYGGFGVTYIGWDGRLEQKVAIKEYLPGEFSTRMLGHSQVKVFGGEKSEQYHDGLVRFIEEARRLAKFQNEPGIVKIFDSFEENDTAYIIMEYLDGETLTSYMDREGTVTEDQAVQMLLPILESLKIVHAEGILHRDIAPDNIFLTKDGEVKLIDFGASRYATTSHSRSLTVIIKPGYSPEEQYRSRGDQGPYTDVYTLAATMYKMVTGQTPPDAMERRAKYENQNKDILVPPHKLKKGISAIRENAILNAMNVRIEDRTPDVDSFISELTSKTPAKRKYGKIKKIDAYAWPTWVKVLLPSVFGVALVFGALLLSGVISFQSRYAAEIVTPENMVSVPNVEGMDKDEAIAKIKAAGMNVVTGGTFSSEYVPAGRIALQEPNAGNYIELGGIIELTVSSGTGALIPVNGISTMPYIIWDNEEDAISKLRTAGFVEPVIIRQYDETVSESHVISASIAAGQETTEGSSIQVVISKGRVPAVVSCSAGSEFTVGLRTDGSLTVPEYTDICDTWTDVVDICVSGSCVTGLNSEGAVNVETNNSTARREILSWKDIVAISAGQYHTVGLRSDGTVVAVGYDGHTYKDGQLYYSQCDVSEWTDIIAIDAAYEQTIGLRADGTVIATSEYRMPGSDFHGWSHVSEWTEIIAISAGSYHTVGLKKDGTVVAVGENEDGQCDVSGWTDIVAIDAEYNHTVGLKEDGTVVAVGENEYGQCDVSGWTDIVAIDAGDYHTVGLRVDGTVVAAGDNRFGQCDVSDWTEIVSVWAWGRRTIAMKSDGTFVSAGGRQRLKQLCSWENIVAVSVGCFHTVGLRADGTVIAEGNLNDVYGQCEVSNWENIIVVSAGDYHTVGLRANGTVVAVGDNRNGQCDVSDWTDIVAVSAGYCHTVGLRADGTVVAAGSKINGFNYGQCEVSNWENIIAVSAGHYHTVGLRADGTVVAVGDNRNGQCDVSDWTDIVAVSAGYCHTVGLRADGTVIAAGDNNYGQCDVSDWTDIIDISSGAYHTVGLKADEAVIAVGCNLNGQCEVSNW